MNLPIADLAPTASGSSAASQPADHAYAYSYPHKSSYGPLDPPVPLEAAWAEEDVSRLSLYVHIPFCEMRCGFCNLFTRSQPGEDVVEAYLAALLRQTKVAHDAVPTARFHQFAVGGGTPTLLSAPQWERLLTGLEGTLGMRVRDVPTSVEASPATAEPERLRLLAEFGVQRISLGVQSFVEAEARGMGRPQRTADVHKALETIRRCGFPTLNIDLIYGDPRQTRESWRTSLEAALTYAPEELYLYPLYIRPQTGLARSGRGPAEHRSDLYRDARDLLRERGYRQTSLRGFRLPRNEGPCSYACQRDGMIGLGCGARSYTSRLHYAAPFAVTQGGVEAVLREWIGRSDERFAHADYGVRLSDEEQRRRFTIMSLLQAEGMPLADYAGRFGGSPWDDVPELAELEFQGWLERRPDRIVLTEEGLERSDEVGPRLYSPAVRTRLREFVQLPPTRIESSGPIAAPAGAAVAAR